MQSQALFFFSYLGVFNGLILSIYFFFFRSKRTLSTYMLGALLLVLSIRIGKSVAYFFDFSLAKTYLQLGLTACFFIGPFLYFFTKAETGKIKQLPKSWKVQLMIWASVIVLVGIAFPYEIYPALWGQTIIPLIYLQWAVYVALSIFMLIPTVKKIFRRQAVTQSEKWATIIAVSLAVILACYVWAYLNITKGSYLSGALWFSIAIYAVVLALVYRKKTNDLFAHATPKYADKKFDPREADRIIKTLNELMIEKKLFRNSNLKVNDLAKEINISAHQLSQVLNDNIQKNFTLFVNEYRINEACHLLSQKTNLSIEGIGFEVGFNSKSTFFTCFKKLKGSTPSAYQQQALAN